MSQPPDLLVPRHGFRGDRERRRRDAPLGLAVALSRESGARGGTIGRLAGQRLGWQVYDQELLEFMAQDAVARQGLMENLSPAGLAWVEGRLADVRRQYGFADGDLMLHLSRLVLALAAGGEVVLIGRGAGFILPRETTLNVRIVAPLAERVAYLGQSLRLASEEAAEKVCSRDERRAEFLTRHFRRRPDDVQQYDLILNSSQLGEEACAELITVAARLRGEQGDGGP